MGKVALITGVTGQDGALLSRLLIDKGYFVVGIDRRTSSKTDWRLKELNLYSEPSFKVASGDLTDPGSLVRLVQEYQPTEFYNLAAMSFVKESWNTPSATHQINSIGTINCLEAIRHHKPDCKFYQASTSEMFGGTNRAEILNEEAIFYPRSPYGISKVSAHWSTINYRESFDMFCCCGILFNHESEYRGIEFVTRKITDGIARIYWDVQDTIELGSLDTKRDWGYAGDFVRGMWDMLQADKPDDYVLATGKSRSIKEFIDVAFPLAGFNNGHDEFIKQSSTFMRPADVGHLLGDFSKARELLGWEPYTSFKEMVSRMVKTDIERVRIECGEEIR
ncbi:MAG: GDP-mannose 4,6-dehydratase [Candidatus Hodarchaeales archaeon]|jgi:GDPmannose 4,6-dehydratase